MSYIHSVSEGNGSREGGRQVLTFTIHMVSILVEFNMLEDKIRVSIIEFHSYLENCFEDATLVQVQMDVNFVQFTFCNIRKKGNTVESDKINVTYSSKVFEFFSNNNMQESGRDFIC